MRLYKNHHNIASGLTLLFGDNDFNYILACMIGIRKSLMDSIDDISFNPITNEDY